MNETVDNSVLKEKNQEQWDRLLFALENRNKSTLAVISFDHDETKTDIYGKMIKNFPQYRFFDADMSAKSIVSLQRALKENLPESVLLSRSAEYIVNVFGLENSIFVLNGAGNLKQSQMISELNFEREILFREFPFVIILWLNQDIVKKLRKEAQDLWDWINYHFEFKGEHEYKETVKKHLGQLYFPKSQRIKDLQAKYEKLDQADSLKERIVREKITIQKLIAQEYTKLHDYDEAIPFFQTALELSRQIPGLEYDMADISFLLGEAYFGCGEYNLALESYQLSLDIQEKHENWNAGVVYYRIGMVYENQGRLVDALENYKKALGWHEKSENYYEMGKTYYQMGSMSEARQKWSDALVNYTKALKWYEKTGNDNEIEKVSRQIKTVVGKQGITNLYNNRGMLPYNSDMFFGRRVEMRRIESLLNSENPACVSIVGERRIGKSSLAFRIFHKIMDSDNTIAIYLDCDELSEQCDSKDEFFQILNRKFLACLEGKPGIRERLGSYGDKLFENYSSFKGFVGKESRNGLKFIIFMDEFEHLPDKDFANDTFFSNLRAMANNSDNRLAYVTVSQSNLRALTHKAIQTSGFWNIFTPEMIALLDDRSVSELRRYGFEKNNTFLEKDEKKMIGYYAGAFPFFNQIVCRYIFDSKIDKAELDRDALEIALLPYYEKLWENRTRDEQKSLENLKDGDQSYSLKEMKIRGLLIKENAGYQLFCGFFLKLVNEYFNLDNAVVQSEKDVEFDVFLCCNSADKPAVRELGKKLKKMDISPWLDEWELRPGLPWQKALEKQIKNIRAAAVFVGKNGIGPWQDMEQAAFIRQFVKRGCPVIPVILSDCIEEPELPAFLEGMMWVDFRKKDTDPMKLLKWGITGERE